MKRSKVLALAVFAAIVAALTLTGTAQAASMAKGVTITNGTTVYTITTVNPAKTMAQATTRTGVTGCFTTVQPKVLSTAWKMGTTKVWKYSCPTSRAW